LTAIDDQDAIFENLVPKIGEFVLDASLKNEGK